MIKNLQYVILVTGLCLQVAYGQQNDIWSLRRCIDYALANNLNIKQAELNLQTSQVDLKEARAARHPNLNANTGGNVNNGRSIDPFSNEFTEVSVTSSNFSVSTSLNLFTGFRTYNSIKRSELDLQANKLDLDQSKQDIILNTTLAYLTIIFNDELLASAEAQVAATKKQRDRTAKLVDAGTLAQSSLLEIESQIATEELNVVNARNQLEVSYLNLMQLLYLDPVQPFGIERPNLENPNLTQPIVQLSELYKAGEISQPLIRAADLRIKSADLNEKVAKGAYYPTLQFSASAATGYSSLTQRGTGEFETITSSSQVLVQGFPLPGVEQPFPVVLSQSREIPLTSRTPFADQLSDNRRSGLSLNLSIPIYNRRQTKSAVERARIQKKLAENTALIRRQTLNQNIQQAYVDVKNALATYQQTEAQIESLELTFQNSEKQFNFGVMNSVDFLIAKTNLNRAKFDLIRAKYDYIFRSKILDFYQGKSIGFE